MPKSVPISYRISVLNMLTPPAVSWGPNGSAEDASPVAGTVGAPEVWQTLAAHHDIKAGIMGQSSQSPSGLWYRTTSWCTKDHFIFIYIHNFAVIIFVGFWMLLVYYHPTSCPRDSERIFQPLGRQGPTSKSMWFGEGAQLEPRTWDFLPQPICWAWICWLYRKLVFPHHWRTEFLVPANPRLVVACDLVIWAQNAMWTDPLVNMQEQHPLRMAFSCSMLQPYDVLWKKSIQV